EALNGVGKIWISIKVDDHYSLRIDVQDNGPGIPPDKVTRIFEAYFTTKEKGSGLGLSIVKHNTEMYNGKVEVRSTEGQGTLFTVKLPSKTVIKFRK
ncbi:MAG: HAMP domain-containing histidine kinase, partial [Pedosphaera sp.]|nr:HAMP domain-containing histidine kinase [Pedosphaera sp.]